METDPMHFHEWEALDPALQRKLAKDLNPYASDSPDGVLLRQIAAAFRDRYKSEKIIEVSAGLGASLGPLTCLTVLVRKGAVGRLRLPAFFLGLPVVRQYT